MERNDDYLQEIEENIPATQRSIVKPSITHSSGNSEAVNAEITQQAVYLEVLPEAYAIIKLALSTPSRVT